MCILFLVLLHWNMIMIAQGWKFNRTSALYWWTDFEIQGTKAFHRKCSRVLMDLTANARSHLTVWPVFNVLAKMLNTQAILQKRKILDKVISNAQLRRALRQLRWNDHQVSFQRNTSQGHYQAHYKDILSPPLKSAQHFLWPKRGCQSRSTFILQCNSLEIDMESSRDHVGVTH